MATKCETVSEREIAANGAKRSSIYRKKNVLPLRNQHSLIVNSRDKAISVAYKLLRSWGASLEREEIVSAVDLALCLAARRFNPAAKVDFLTFAFYSLRGTLIQAIKARVACQEVSIGLTNPDDGLEPGTSNEYLADRALDQTSAEAELESSPEHQFYVSELKERCHDAFDHLSELEQKIIYMADFKGLNVNAVAKKLGYSRGHTSMLRSTAHRKMRSKLWMYDKAA